MHETSNRSARKPGPKDVMALIASHSRTAN